jgi:hypothetical protein
LKESSSEAVITKLLLNKKNQDSKIAYHRILKLPQRPFSHNNRNMISNSSQNQLFRHKTKII